MIKNKPCKHCKSPLHTSIMCFSKPRKPIKPRSDKTKLRELEFRGAWLQANPSPWVCYLQISPWCPKKLDIDSLTMEHVIPKGSNPKGKYDLDNVKPSCTFCNGLKSSRSIESLAKEYPRLRLYLD